MTRRGDEQRADAEEKRSARRRFLKAVPVAVAGAVGTKALAQGPAPAGSVTPTVIDCAEKIAGLEMHSDEEAAMERKKREGYF